MKIIKQIEKFIEDTMVSISAYPISVTLTMMFYMIFQYDLVNGKLFWMYVGQIVLMFDKSGFEVAIRKYLRGKPSKQNFAFPVISSIYLVVSIYFWSVTGQRLLLTLTIEQLIWTYLFYIAYKSISKRIIEQKQEDSE
jgi:hypothetical protein